MLVHLEGNIASGKTTLGEALAADPNFHFIPEPVEEWQTGFTENMLDRFYRVMDRWSFTFQICTFATRVAALRDLPSNQITVAERSIGCDRYVFAPSLYEQGALDTVEWDIYCRLWEEMAPRAPLPDAILYLRTPAAECLRRLQVRRRAEEDSISLEYLLKLEERHDAWLLPLPQVIVLDGTERWTPDDILDRLNERQL
jgi:deoxyadenosine/deoxycytidine kinase